MYLLFLRLHHKNNHYTYFYLNIFVKYYKRYDYYFNTFLKFQWMGILHEKEFISKGFKEKFKTEIEEHEKLQINVQLNEIHWMFPMYKNVHRPYNPNGPGPIGLSYAN